MLGRLWLSRSAGAAGGILSGIFQVGFLTMKALSVRQPWASLIALEHKQFETRSWALPAAHLNSDQWFALHAAKRWTARERDCAVADPIGERLLKAGVDLASDQPLPLGSIIALFRFGGCFMAGRRAVGEFELAVGDYTAGRFAFEIRDVRVLAQPVLASGLLGFWEVPAEAVAEIESQIGASL